MLQIWDMTLRYPVDGLLYPADTATSTEASPTKNEVLSQQLNNEREYRTKDLTIKGHTGKDQLTPSTVNEVVFVNNLQSCP